MKALILVDIQNDFLPGGALEVPAGDEVVPVANRLIEQFDFVVATQDWHPPDHVSFASRHEGRDVGETIDLDGLDQILWPDHCVRETPGAEFPEALDADKADEVVRKGTDRRFDSYSAFFDNAHRKATGLDGLLRDRGVDSVYLCGLAADVCVKFSALDARRLGYATFVVTDGCRGVELDEGDVQRAMDEMAGAGVTFVHSNELAG